jgi:hypothetical protein
MPQRQPNPPQQQDFGALGGSLEQGVAAVSGAEDEIPHAAGIPPANTTLITSAAVTERRNVEHAIFMEPASVSSFGGR